MNTPTPRHDFAMLRLVFPVILIWGCNFAVMRGGIDEIGPFTLAAMRFFIAAVPLIFFVRKPPVPFGFVAAYAAAFGLGQFGFLFLAIYWGLPSGMASLLVQLQAVFTPIFALVFLTQRIPTATGLAILVALGGLSLILWDSGSSGPIPLLLGVAAAMSWGASNVVIAWGAKAGLTYNPVALVIRASALLPIPFLILAGLTGELETVSLNSLLRALPYAVYLGLIATVIAYMLWVRAIAASSATSVAPFSLLIPLIGLALGAVLFDETLSMLRMAGSAMIVVGIAVHIAGLRLAHRPSERIREGKSP